MQRSVAGRLSRRSFISVGCIAGALVWGRDIFEGVNRIIAIGDIHGDYDRLVDLLRTAKLIDEDNAWIGGASHLVLTGDYIDRGPASRKVMDLLIQLGPQAARAGGQIHPLIGNHEAMNIAGDLRYVSKSDFESYRLPNSADLREKAFLSALAERKQKGSKPAVAAFRKQFEAQHPLGWVEQRILFSGQGKYGKWLRQQNAIIKIDDVIFLHGGISLKYAAMSRAEINRRVRDALDDLSKYNQSIATDPDGPLWYRGLAELPENDAKANAAIKLALKTQKAGHIVIGHTPRLVVMPRFAGKVVVIDVGLSRVYGGPPAFLLIEKNKLYVVYRGSKVELPTGSNVTQYFRTIAALEPPGSRTADQLRKLAH